VNIDRLIDRIEKALREEGTTDPVFHALAKEYAKFRTQIDERLEHCVTLIRSGKDFAARELAEQSPDVLTLMEKLSFANDGKWRKSCEEKGLYMGPTWAEEHVDLLNGLYDKEITEDSPLFREYRTAARSRDQEKTFKILKMILKANPDHGAAKRHFGQLSVKILEDKIKELSELITAGREAEFLDLMIDIEDTDWVVQPKGDQWDNALAVREGVERRNAKARLEQILVEIASFRAADDWKGSLALIGEFFNLAQEHGLENELAADDINVYNEYKQWAEELGEDAKSERELEAMISRFKNRLAEMHQAEAQGGKSLEIYLEEQNELRKFRQEFQDIGKSLSAEIMMDLQKADTHVKNRILSLRGRTKRLWVAGVCAFVLVAMGSVAGLWWLKGFWDARTAAESVLEAPKPSQQWEKLSAFIGNYPDYLEDVEVRKYVDQAFEKIFRDAGANLISESQDEFLLKTQDQALLPIIKKEAIERKRANVVLVMCGKILADLDNDPNFQIRDAKRFVELFETAPRIRKNEKGETLPLDEVDYYRFQDNKIVLDKLQEIAAFLARIEDTNDRKGDRFNKLKKEVLNFDAKVLKAWKAFRDTGKVDHGILAQGKYLDELDDETRGFSGSDAIDPNDYREVRDAIRQLKQTWKGYSKEVENKSGSSYDGLLNQADKLLSQSKKANSRDQKIAFLRQMSGSLSEITALNSSSTDQERMTSAQDREFKELVKAQKDSVSALGELGEVEGDLGKAQNLNEYFFALEKLLQNEAFEKSKASLVRNVLSHRKKFSNENGELRSKLFIEGPAEIWEKVEAGEITLNPEESRKEYDHIMTLLSRPDLRNIWNYQLVECSPQKSNQSGVYTTQKKPMMALYSYGPVKEEEVAQKFNEQGQPIANPVKTRVQVGEFHWNGKVEGREFETMIFGGGSKGLAVEEGELTPESTFLQQQIERRLDPNTKRVAGPLMEMLEVVIAEQSISPILKAYLHREIVELMKQQPASWGVALSNQLLKDYDSLLSKVKIRIRPTDWMDKKANESLDKNLAQFYREIGKRDYFPEANFTLGVLQDLQKAEFSYIGHVDIQKKARFKGVKPILYWGISQVDGAYKLAKGSSASLVAYTPLVGTNPKIEEILSQNYNDAKVAKGKFGGVEEFIPVDFSN
jgi:hypothetical protein